MGRGKRPKVPTAALWLFAVIVQGTRLVQNFGFIVPAGHCPMLSSPKRYPPPRRTNCLLQGARLHFQKWKSNHPDTWQVYSGWEHGGAEGWAPFYTRPQRAGERRHTHVPRTGIRTPRTKNRKKTSIRILAIVLSKLLGLWVIFILFFILSCISYNQCVRVLHF